MKVSLNPLPLFQLVDLANLALRLIHGINQIFHCPSGFEITLASIEADLNDKISSKLLNSHPI